MKFKNSMLVVDDIIKSRDFYCDLFALRVMHDLGQQIILSKGVCLQSKDSWIESLDLDESKVVFGGNDSEIYFEIDDFEGFVRKLHNRDIYYVHRVRENEFGQRIVRFYDLDKHIVEVGESVATTFLRLSKAGKSVNQIAKITKSPVVEISKILGK